MPPTPHPRAPIESLPDGFAPGTKIGRYRLIALLASGGMAHVWAAAPDGGGGIARTVALKIVRPELSGDLDYARMFIDEATIATAVHHPNVCETYELDRDDNTLFMAMEWVAGDSLGGLLRQGRNFVPLDLPVAVRICADACAGLHAAHEAVDGDGNPLGVIHRDVSPPNILISLHGQVKVSDFGIAKARYQLHERTKTGEVKGKFGYLAPEQITGEPSDRRVDVYAMGCVLYVATMGLRPFGNGPEAMSKILLGEYKRPREIDPMYPPDLEEIVVRALQHKPADRYATADEMREALERWLMASQAVVTQADIARCVRDRMDPSALEAVQQLLNRSKGKSNLAYQMLLQTLEVTQTPTASSGLINQPEGLRVSDGRIPIKPPPNGLSDPPVAGRAAPTVAPSTTKDERSGWHRTSRTEANVRKTPLALLLVGGMALVLLLLWLLLQR
jgi:serine/threonine-protein kinase